MRLNTISPAQGSKKAKTRVGRGIGSTLGKTCGKGHKGQKARSGGYHKVGFEGGQMPLQRRIPKFGFKSRVSIFTEQLRLSNLNCFDNNAEVTLDLLKEKNLIKQGTKFVKIFAHGEITNPISIKGLKVTAGAKLLIEKAGGKIISSDDE